MNNSRFADVSSVSRQSRRAARQRQEDATAPTSLGAGRSRSRSRPASLTLHYEDVPARAVLFDPFGIDPGFTAARTSPRVRTRGATSA